MASFLDHWRDPRTGDFPEWAVIGVPALASLAALIPFYKMLPLGGSPWLPVGLGLLTAGGIAGLTAFLRRCPRTPPGRVGVILALATDKDEYAVQLRHDFVRRFRELASGRRLKRPFEVIEYPQRLARQVIDGRSAIAALERSRAQFIIYGASSVRYADGAERHVLEPRYVVRHAPLDEAQQEVVGRELTLSVTQEMKIRREHELEGFQVASTFLEMATRYVVGVAALHSRDLDFAEETLASVLDVVPGRHRELPPVRRMLAKTPALLGVISGIRASGHHNAFIRDRDVQHVAAAEPHWDRVLAVAPMHYQALLGKAICCFVLRRDVAGARRCYEACRPNVDSMWMYGVAFLCAYEGRLAEARKLYRRATRVFASEVSDANQCEQFIEEIWQAEPERIQLGYALGLINLWAKRDLEAAGANFRAFREADTTNRFAREHAWAEQELAAAWRERERRKRRRQSDRQAG